MKIVHINTLDTGGAAKACIRLHLGLLEHNIDSNLVSLHKTTSSVPKHYSINQSNIGIVNKTLASLKARVYYNRNARVLKNRPIQYGLFSFPDGLVDINELEIIKEADIINLHWTSGFPLSTPILDYQTFFKKNKKKIVWTLHDMNTFTGGCHYSGNCKGYENSCDICPQLKGACNPDYSNNIWEKKKRSFENTQDITVVCPSSWLSGCSQNSSLLRSFTHYVIPNGVDERIFEPKDKFLARKVLGIPLDKKILLFVADNIKDERKGFKILLEAVSDLDLEETYICTIGSSDLIKDKRLTELGVIQDESIMSMAYSAADVFIIPSLEDNLPNTVLESLMCGTPVVGFAIGGINDMIKNDIDGLLTESTNSQGLADSIRSFFNRIDNFDRKLIRERALLRYSLDTQALNYINLYNKIINT